jgi:BirA family transcriptional regulator, biotin operon repressor / biotin---[acetyl-CoA-carboxylase] ligase
MPEPKARARDSRREPSSRRVVVRFGVPRHHHRLVGSTNDAARELALAGAPSGTVVTAAEQSAGRGRTGRRWSAPPGTALLATAILRPLDERNALLPLAVPVAVCEAIEALAPLRCEVKWPNDIWIAERKVAGVLIEARPPDWAAIGVGVNLAIPDDAFPGDLRWAATSVGHGVDADAMLAALCERLDRRVDAPAAEILAAFRGRDALRGRRIAWEGSGGAAALGSGVADGVDERGNLRVRADSGGLVALGAGEVRLAL